MCPIQLINIYRAEYVVAISMTPQNVIHKLGVIQKVVQTILYDSKIYTV
jgi:hypothetical protein